MDMPSVSQTEVNFVRTGDVITIKGTGSAISLGFEIWPNVPLLVRSDTESSPPCDCRIQILTEPDSIVFSGPFSGETCEHFTVRELARHRVVVSAPNSLRWSVDVKDSPPQFVGPTPTPTTAPQPRISVGHPDAIAEHHNLRERRRRAEQREGNRALRRKDKSRTNQAGVNSVRCRWQRSRGRNDRLRKPHDVRHEIK